MRMLRWMCGVTREDWIKNDRIRETVKAVEVSAQGQERTLQWFGHVERRYEDYMGRSDGHGGAGQAPVRKTLLHWKDKVKGDIRERQLAEEMVVDWNRWW